jgi:hypothetical protein
LGIVLVLVVLRPRPAGVFCSGKSPIVPIVKHQDFSRTKDDDEHEDEDELRNLGLVRPVMRGVGVRAGGWSVVIAAIVVRPMVILRISNPSGIARARGCAERGVSL